MKEWIKTNILQSATMWVFAVLVILATIVLFLGRITGDAYIVFLPIAAGIALGKRAATQAIVGNRRVAEK